MEYVFEDGQNVRLVDSGLTGYITSRVPGNGTGDGFYYVASDDPPHDETGPYLASELEAY
jgi:hypothetical protein